MSAIIHVSRCQVSGSALLVCAALQTALLLVSPGLCWLLVTEQSLRAVNAAYGKDAMFSPVAFSTSTSFISLQQQAKS